MPKDPTLKKILIIGSGPIIISQGCEFDYAGTQACKALKEEGCYVILVNPNPATIMTDPDVAHATYIEPLVPELIEKIIEKEHPDAILPTMGGQTALNCTLELEKLGILTRYGIRIIGVSTKTIKSTEDRGLFKQVLNKLNLDHPFSFLASNLEEVRQNHHSFSYPKIVRTSYTLGGTGSGVAYNLENLLSLCTLAFEQNNSHEVLIEESLLGWKEFELEVMRDAAGNFIVVCSIENIDPMGVHTGDSITVAPAQTLTDKEYQKMRNNASLLMQEIGMTSGGCNIQFAINPKTGRMVVIEMNPRVSRSSALASKATGFPIAKLAAKIALGYNLNELANDITQSRLPASFEPSIDYVATKIPRFNFDKFPEADSTLTTQMKAVGEIMALGRTFQESLQKALRSLENGYHGLEFNVPTPHTIGTFTQLLTKPHEHRILYIAEAYRRQWSTENIYKLTQIDPWFLEQIKDLISLETKLSALSHKDISKEILLFCKQKGISDQTLAKLTKGEEREIYNLREKFNIHPVFKRIDSCAAEFISQTSYLYSTYEQECEANPTLHRKIVIIGSGPNRIGQGIEFDYCCVHGVLASHESGYEGIVINCNPETVSTDYDCADRLYFEPLTFEDIREILILEKPTGIIIQFGGQTPLLLADKLLEEGFQILGTQPKFIHLAEDREKFKNLLDSLGLNQPKNEILRQQNDALKLAGFIGYPMILRPSYVLGGRGLVKINNKQELLSYCANFQFTNSHLLIEEFIEEAIEIDVDAICDGNDVFICGIMEQFELAGTHSGDSTCVIPHINLKKHISEQIINQTKIIAISLNIIGFINIQFLIKNDKVYILEANPRASRTIPFLSKALGISLTKIATNVLLGVSLKKQNCLSELKPKLIAIKKPIFSFHKLPGAINALSPEMKSTGEIMVLGRTLEEALLKLRYFQPEFLRPSSIEINHMEVYSLQSNIRQNIDKPE